MELEKLTALQLADKIKKHEVSVLDGVKDVFSKIEEKDNRIHAYLDTYKKEAYARAKEVEKGAKSGKKTYSRTAMILAILTPVAFLMDILFMILFKLKGGDATSLVAGTAVLLMCAGTVMEFKVGSLEKVTEYVTDGFLFAIRIFAPVIVIGAFFFLGGNGIIHILGDSYERGILNDWLYGWLIMHL
mgnify:CR=1 FL=1